MKLLLENWKRYIKESEEELWDIGEYNPDPSKRYRSGYENRSVGYGVTEDYPSFVSDVKSLMSKTGDRWVLITIDDVNYIDKDIKSREFKTWLKSKKYPKDSKIVIIGSSPLQGDYKHPKWFLHDVLGHTIGEFFINLDSRGKAGSANEWLNEYNLEEKPLKMKVVESLFPLLDPKVSPVPLGEKEDKVYDIFGSFALEYLTLDEALSAVKTPEEKQLVNRMFTVTKNWINNIKPNVPTIIFPW